MTYIPRPAGMETRPMGLVKDTDSARRAEIRYGVSLVGYTVCWNEKMRVYVWDSGLRLWHGPYTLNDGDLQTF